MRAAWMMATGAMLLTTPAAAQTRPDQQAFFGLYKELEELSGQSCSLHLTGGVMLADSPERMDFLRLAHAKGVAVRAASA